MTAKKPKKPQAKRIEFHVVPRQGGGAWNVRRNGALIVMTSTQRRAIRDAIALAKQNAVASVRVHGRDGRMRFEYSYGRDPRRYKG